MLNQMICHYYSKSDTLQLPRAQRIRMEKRTEIIFQELFSAQVSAFPASTELDEDQDRWSQKVLFPRQRKLQRLRRWRGLTTKNRDLTGGESQFPGMEPSTGFKFKN